MSPKTDKKVEIIKVYENVKSPSTKFMSILEIIPLSLITCTIYPLAYEIISLFNLHNAITNTIMLFVYILMLWCASIFINSMRKKRKGKDEFNLEKSEIAAVFNLMLLLNFICLLVIGFSKKDATYLTMATLSITLYVGFTISLEEVFDNDVKSKIFLQLLCPFSDLCIGMRDWWKVFIVISFAVIYMYHPVIVLVLIVVVTAVFVLAIFYGKNNARNFGEQIIKMIHGDKITIVHIGAENAVTKAFLKTIAKDCEISEIQEKCFQQSDHHVLIIVNTINNKELYLPWLKNIENGLSKNCIIIDPFISKKNKRSMLSSWFFLKPSFKKWTVMQDYINSII